MGDFDYSPAWTPSYSPGINAGGDALLEALKRRRENQQFEEKLQFEREDAQRKFKQNQAQVDYQNRILNERDKRDRFEFRRKNTEYLSQRGGLIRKAIADNNPQLAEQLAAETEAFDPDTGAVTRGKLTAGAPRDVGPAPTAPEEPQKPEDPMLGPVAPPEIQARRRGMKPPEPEPGAMEGPIPDRGERTAAELERPGALNMSGAALRDTLDVAHAEDDAQQQQRDELSRRVAARQLEGARYTDEEQAALDRAGAASAAYPEARQRYESDLSKYDVQRQEHDAEVRAAKNERPYTLQFGEGPPQTIDMRTQRYASREAAAQDFLASLPAGMSEKDRAAAQMTYSAILSGGDTQKAIEGFQKERIGIANRGERAAEGEANRQNKIDVAKINSRKPGLVLQERRFQASQDKDIRKETRGDVEKWLKASGLDKAPNQVATMRQSLAQLNGNGKEQQAALVGMARATQGDNRFSDADYRVFVSQGGVGKLDELDSTMQKLVDGQFGDETIAVAKQMAHALQAMYDQRLKDAANDGREEFVHNEIYDPQVAESVLEQRLGKAYYQRESGRGGPRGGALGAPPEISARRKGAASRSVTVKASGSSTEDLLKALEGP